MRPFHEGERSTLEPHIAEIKPSLVARKEYVAVQLQLLILSLLELNNLLQLCTRQEVAERSALRHLKKFCRRLSVSNRSN